MHNRNMISDYRKVLQMELRTEYFKNYIIMFTFSVNVLCRCITSFRFQSAHTKNWNEDSDNQLEAKVLSTQLKEKLPTKAQEKENFTPSMDE